MIEQCDYLIVGGGVAGGHAAYEIRKNDKKGTIVVVTAENQFPYDRPPLSKEYLAGKKKRNEVFFRADSYYSRNKIEVVKPHHVESMDTSRNRITIDGGREFSYKTLLLSTGGRPRRLNLPGAHLQGIYYLRTLLDCDAIRKASSSAKKVAIIGGGFIGCEVAATLRGKRKDVTLIEMAPRLLSAAIDEETASWLKEYHVKKGVKVLLNSSVSQFVGSGDKVEGVELIDGTNVAADFVVVGVGIELNTELAEGAGIKTDKGVVVNEHLETSVPNIYAAGDIAKFYSPLFKRYLRLEHVDVAQKQGAIAGENMTGKKKKKKKSFDEPPYFFSNQYDLEINAYGDLSQHSHVLRRGALDARKGFIQFYFDEEILNGILTVNAKWSDIEEAKSLIAVEAKYDRSMLADESRPLKSIARKVTRKGRS
ncbi:MAG: FAD-dependent oxidoreductase [Thaumarchaeota archaeon]|nr:FAD-dependent oxidoreductase [Nitrososphaerota archaeon]